MSEFFVHVSQVDDQLMRSRTNEATLHCSKPDHTGRLIIDVRLVISSEAITDPAAHEQQISVVVDLTTQTAREHADKGLAELPIKVADTSDITWAAT